MAQKPEENAADMVSRKEYEQLKTRIAELEQQVNALTEALRLAQHKRFGASSEKTVDDGSQQLSFLFNEAEAIADHEAAQDKQETLVAAHKRHKKHEYTLDNLPEGMATEVDEHRVPQDEPECPILRGEHAGNRQRSRPQTQDYSCTGCCGGAPLLRICRSELQLEWYRNASNNS